MNNKEIISSVHNSMYQQVKKTGYATSEQVLIDLKYLSKEDYEKWRFGKIDYLERVCKVNLHKLNFILSQMQAYAKSADLKQSYTYYGERKIRIKSNCDLPKQAMSLWRKSMQQDMWQKRKITMSNCLF